MSDLVVGRIEQIARAHKSARPKQDNPAWVHTHKDLGIVLDEIKRLRAALNEIVDETDGIDCDGCFVRNEIAYKVLDKP